MSRVVRLAAAQGPVFTATDWDALAAELGRQTEQAVRTGAQLLVFPEYGGMVLSGLADTVTRADLHAQLAELQRWRDDWLALHRQLARKHGIYLLAGSLPWRRDDARYVNRAFLCAPGGGLGFQDKQVMTRFEREQWSISAGEPLRVFDTELGLVGINICYDVEFPLIARRQAEAGAELLLVPSCTDTLAGYRRVRIGAQARALENQCVVLQAPLVGELPWSPAIDVNIGAAGVYGPPDLGFPASGVLAEGRMNQPGWVLAEVDLGAVHAVRAQGQVLNYRHWPEQLPGGLPLPRVERVRV